MPYRQADQVPEGYTPDIASSRLHFASPYKLHVVPDKSGYFFELQQLSVSELCRSTGRQIPYQSPMSHTADMDGSTHLPGQGSDAEQVSPESRIATATGKYASILLW
jgi:hypothetical protein